MRRTKGVGKTLGADFRGGLRWEMGNITWPFVKLGPGGNGLYFAVDLPRALTASFERYVPLDRIVYAQRARGRFGSPGIHFVVEGRPPFTFWTFEPDRVLGFLGSQGVSIREGVHRVKFFGT